MRLHSSSPRSTRHFLNFFFLRLNFHRSQAMGAFPRKITVPPNLVKKVCDVVYHCPGPGGTPVFTPGVLRCRYVADSGDYSVVDMIPRSKLWGSMCSFCSDVKQAPVYHKRDRTPCLGRAAPASRVGIVQPDPNRIVVNTHPSFIPSIIIYPCHPPPSHSGPTNEQKMEERIKEGPRSLPLCCKRLSLQILQNVVARQQPHGQAPQVLAQ